MTSMLKCPFFLFQLKLLLHGLVKQSEINCTNCVVISCRTIHVWVHGMLYGCVRGYKIKSCNIFVLYGTVMLDEMYYPLNDLFNTVQCMFQK